MPRRHDPHGSQPHTSHVTPSSRSIPLAEPPRRAARNRRLARVLMATVALVLLSITYQLRVRSSMSDFAVNFQAGQRLAKGDALYRVTDGHFMFKYLPASAFVYLPLVGLPSEVAKAVWFACSLAALVGLFTIANRLVPRRATRHALLLSGLVLAKYFLHELRLGQVNILVTCVMLASVGALVSRPGTGAAELRAGTLAGLAIALKPYAALMIPYLIVTRRWRSVAALSVTLAVALAVPTLFYGVEGNVSLLREWAATLSQSTPTLLTNNDNVSVVAFFTKWRGEASRALLPTAVVLGILAALTLAVISRGKNDPGAPVLEGALVLTLIPLVSPLGWDYTFLMSLLAVLLIVNHLQAFPQPARWLLVANFGIVALAVYDVMGRTAYATFMQWSVTTVNFVVVVVALAHLRFRQVC